MSSSEGEKTSMTSDDKAATMDDEKKQELQPVALDDEPGQNQTQTQNPSSQSERHDETEKSRQSQQQKDETDDAIQPGTSHSHSHPQQQTVTSQSSTSASPSSDPSNATGPPSLNYTLRTRKLYITIFWSLILVDAIAIPIVLYFTLDRLTSLSNNAVFSISTGALGGVSVLEYCLRLWRHYKKDSTCRVIGCEKWWWFDFFHWNFSGAWVLVIAELIIGTCFSQPPIRLLAMPLATICFWFGIEIMLEDAARVLGYKGPFRISSIPKGEPLRPGIYSIIEDVVAVDGSGGTDFRKRLDARYLASPRFQRLVSVMSWFWGSGALGIAVVTTAIVWTINRDAAYVVGWTVPFVWAGIWTIVTFWYVLRSLRIERETWAVVKA